MKTAQIANGETGGLFDGRVMSHLDARAAKAEYTTINGFKVGSMDPLPPNVTAAHYDTCHCYTTLEATVFEADGSGRTVYENGRPKSEVHCTIFHNDLGNQCKSDDHERFLIIVDKPTGMRLKVILPPINRE